MYPSSVEGSPSIVRYENSFLCVGNFSDSAQPLPPSTDPLIALGVDGIITDDPAALIAHLARHSLR
jgi:hypothetical protein